MIDPRRFRLVLTARLLDVAALAALSSPLAALGAGCGGTVAMDRAAGGGGAGGSGQGQGQGQGGQFAIVATSSVNASTGSTIPDATSTDSTSTDSTSTGSTTDSTSTGSTSTDSSSTGSSLPTKCFTPTNTDVCPDETQAYAYLSLTVCESVYGPGSWNGNQCCYPIGFGGNCGSSGRPFVVAERAVTAAVRRGASPASWASAPSSPEVGALSAADRATLAQAWLDDARMEHAFIASFARFSLELLAVGAPAELVLAAHAAAMDEVHHARLCFALAGAYSGATLAPEPFPFGGGVTVTSDLAALAAAVVREGCVGETLAALQAAEQLVHATDPAIRAALARIAEDEANHAELAFRTVAWALSQGGESVHRAVAEAFAAAFTEPAGSLPAAPNGVSNAALAAHGRLYPAALRATLARRLDDVVGPCARALLGEGAPAAIARAS